MRLILRCFFFLFLFPCLSGRQTFYLAAQNSPAIQINGQQIITQPNLHQFTVLRKTFVQDEVNGVFYAYIQFDRLPTKTAKEQITAATGIKLLGFLPHNTFYAAIPSSVNIAPLYSFHVKGIYRIEDESKIASKLAGGSFPEYMLNGDGTCRVNILYYSTLDQSFIIEKLAALGIIAKSYSVYSNVLQITVNVNSINDLAALPFVQYIEPAYPPVVSDNLEARTAHRANFLSDNAAAQLQYDGTGVYIAMNDDGEIGGHIDFGSRVDNAAVAGEDAGDHGDHIAGTIMGAGNLDSRVKGHASGAQIKSYFAYHNGDPEYGGWYDIPNSYYDPGVTITNTAVSDLICNEGYNSLSQMLDQQANDYPLLIHVISAGNSGQEDCGTLPGYFNITGGHKQAKNCLTVGNVDTEDKLDDLSSRGPAKDGRLKPEVMAVGVDVFSTYGDNEYKSLTGTSMSAAGVTGTLALLTEAYRDLTGLNDCPAILLKASLMNTADDMGWGGPDWKHGYGRINALRAYNLILAHNYFFDTVNDEDIKSYSFAVPDNVTQVRVMLYWNDAAASLGAPKDLVNDLQLELTQPGGETLDPWILDHSAVKDSLNKTAWRGIDTLNNHEQITLNNPSASEQYTITISGKVVPEGPQPFVVVYEFIYDDVILTYPVGGESWIPFETERIRWTSSGTLKPLTLDISFDEGTTWNLIANLDSIAREYEYIVPSIITGKGKVRISRSDAIDETETTFSIMNLPSNLNVDEICPLSVHFTWDEVDGATMYEVFKLGENEMDSVGTTTNNYFDIEGLNINEDDWLTVRAIGNDNATSRRAIAYKKPTGLLNCTLTNDLSLSQMLPAPFEFTSCMELNAVPVTVIITNTASETVSDIEVFYKADNGNEISEMDASSILPGETIEHTFTLLTDLSAEGEHIIQCWIYSSGDENPWNDTLIQSLKVTNAGSVSLPLYEGFENFGLCETTNDCSEGICELNNGWRNSINFLYDSIDWRTNEGPTPGEDSGPDIDFDTGNETGNYLYLEAGGCKNKEGQLISPCIDLSNVISPRLAFAYHLYGSNMGSLHLDIFSNGTWSNEVFSVSGDQGNIWLTDTLDLTSYAGSTITLRFRGITGSSSTSDMALDAVSVYDEAVIIPNFSITGSYCVDSMLQFSNISTGFVTSYQWHFGDDASPENAYDVETVFVSYSISGSKTISLTTSNDYTTAVATQAISISDPPVAAFSILQNGDGSFSFLNDSQNADSYEWNFGDGTFSSDVNPSHIYPGWNTYEVSLIAYGECGIDSAMEIIVTTSANYMIGINDVMVYPNPFNDHIFLLNRMDHKVDLGVTVYDISGKILLQHQQLFLEQEKEQCIDFTGANAGIYWLQVSDGRTRYFVKLVKL